MLAEQNPIFSEAAETIYRVTADTRVQALCEGRREGEKTHNTLVLLHNQAVQDLKDTQNELQNAKAYIAELEAKLNQLNG